MYDLRTELKTMWSMELTIICRTLNVYFWYSENNFRWLIINSFVYYVINTIINISIILKYYMSEKQDY